MIAHARTICTHQDRFLEMLPQIRDQARHAFRAEPPERREELIAEVIANCWAAFVRLIERGLIDVIYPTPLVQFAIKQVRDGRRVGTKLNIKDVSSEYAQRRQGFSVASLDRYDQKTGKWREILIEDRHAGPAQTAAARIDIGEWFANLPRRKRRVAATLASGESTKTAARKHRVSPGRISQLRRELMEDWQSFHGEPALA